MLSYSIWQNDPILPRAFTGVDEGEFLALLIAFKTAERKSANKRQNRQRQAGGGRYLGIDRSLEYAKAAAEGAPEAQ